jgi:hypothetical protein
MVHDRRQEVGKRLVARTVSSPVPYRRLLLLTYATGVQVWRASDALNGPVEEVINLRDSERVLCARLIPSIASLDTSTAPILAVVCVEFRSACSCAADVDAAHRPLPPPPRRLSSTRSHNARRCEPSPLLVVHPRSRPMHAS